jgi:hypothetical protein
MLRERLRFDVSKAAQSFILFCLSFVLTGLVAIQNPPMNPDTYCCDHLFYRSMAFNFFLVTRPELNEPPIGNRLEDVYKNPDYSKWIDPANKLNRQPPYSYRILSPLLARTIAFFVQDNIEIAFYVLSFFALALACFFISLSVLDVSKSLVSAGVAGALFSTTFFLSPFNLYDYMLTDPMGYFFISVSVFLMLKRMDGLFFLISLLAVFNKETQFFVLAAYLLVQIHERRLNVASIVMCLLIAFAYGLFRTVVTIPVNRYSFASVFQGFPSPSEIRASAISTFGFSVYLTASRFWLSKFNLLLTPIALGIFFSSLFVGNTERAYVYVFPLVLLAILGVRTDSKITRALSLAPVVAVLAFQWITVPQPFALALLVILEAVFLLNYWLRMPQAAFGQHQTATHPLGWS